jgi:hypothetical protein
VPWSQAGQDVSAEVSTDEEYGSTKDAHVVFAVRKQISQQKTAVSTTTQAGPVLAKIGLM